MAEMNKDTATLLQEMIGVKKDIRTSINNKGVDVVGGMVTYPDAIDRISNIVDVGSEIDYTQIGWAQDNSNDQNEIDAQFINSAIEYTKTLLDNCDASLWTDDSPFVGDKKLVFAPFLYNLKDWDGQSYVNNCVNLFRNCRCLRAVPLFNTSQIGNMNTMFYGCYNLISVPQFDTSGVTDMSDMFYNCYSLTTIPQFDMSKVKDTSYMFYGCSSLLTLPTLDTSGIENVDAMFYGCEKLTTIPPLNISNVTSTREMFYGCYSLTSLGELDTSNVTLPSPYTDGTTMFQDCTNLQDFGGLKGWRYRLDLSYCPNLTYKSLMNVINNLGEPFNSSVQLVISNVSREKLRDDDITVLTNKGWSLSVLS